MKKRLVKTTNLEIILEFAEETKKTQENIIIPWNLPEMTEEEYQIVLHLSTETEKNYENLSDNCTDQNSNWMLPDYKSSVPPLI
jgi:hypothetical protein